MVGLFLQQLFTAGLKPAIFSVVDRIATDSDQKGRAVIHATTRFRGLDTPPSGPGVERVAVFRGIALFLGFLGVDLAQVVCRWVSLFAWFRHSVDRVLAGTHSYGCSPAAKNEQIPGYVATRFLAGFLLFLRIFNLVRFA